MGNDWELWEKNQNQARPPRRSPMDSGNDRKGCPFLILTALAFLSLPAGLVVGFGLWLFS